jgi:hypothetical protein
MKIREDPRDADAKLQGNWPTRIGWLVEALQPIRVSKL